MRFHNRDIASRIPGFPWRSVQAALKFDLRIPGHESTGRKMTSRSVSKCANTFQTTKTDASSRRAPGVEAVPDTRVQLRKPTHFCAYHPKPASNPQNGGRLLPRKQTYFQPSRSSIVQRPSLIAVREISASTKPGSLPARSPRISDVNITLCRSICECCATKSKAC